MSEYQYYEFQAIDRPLTKKEINELRSYSTRARITPASFINDYSWGNFKGDENAWMEKYFDAFLYFANWGTRVLMLRLPARLLGMKTARLYCSGESAFVREKNGMVILTFLSEDGDDYEWLEGAGWLSSLVPVRSELARDDLRALYLGWLLCAQVGDLDDNDIEPPVPVGLGRLSAALESLVEFLRIGTDLLYAASQASRPMEKAKPKHESILSRVAKLPAREKDRLLASLVAAENDALATQLLQQFIRQREVVKDRRSVGRTKRRTVGELLRAAEVYAEERHRIAMKKEAEEKARREREAAIARVKYLDRIAMREPKLWDEVQSLIATKQPR